MKFQICFAIWISLEKKIGAVVSWILNNFPILDTNWRFALLEEVMDYRTYCETMAGLLLNLLLGYC